MAASATLSLIQQLEAGQLLSRANAEAVMELLREKHMDDVLVVIGGIIPDEDAAKLKQLGVAAVFQPGASLDEIVSFIRSSVKQTA